MKTISFDLGGSGGKLYLAEYTRGMLALQEVHRFKNRGIPMGGGLYWDILSIYGNLLAGIGKAVSLAGRGNIASIGLDGFCNDFGLIDARGDLLNQVHCYRDGRTARYRAAIDAVMSSRQRHRLTGTQVALSNTLMHLAAMRQAGQDALLQCADKMLLIPDLLAYYLTGRAVSEYTISSVTEMYDFRKDDWNGEILEAYGIPRALLGEIIRPGTEVGPLTHAMQAELGSGPLKVIAVCEHDTASAFLSAPCRGRAAIISSGTWSLVGTETDGPIINDITYRCNIANEGGFPGPHHRLVKCSMGLWLMQEVQAYYASKGEEYSFADLGALSETAKPFAYLIDPDDTLFFGQGDMPSRIRRRCTEVFGSAPETVGEIVRCIKESLALKYRWAVERLEEITGAALPVVHIVGGGCKDEVLCQYAANACGRPVAGGPADATALGNVMAQLISQGELSGVEEGRQVVQKSYPIKIYEPRDRALWDERYHFFINTFRLEEE